MSPKLLRSLRVTHYVRYLERQFVVLPMKCTGIKRQLNTIQLLKRIPNSVQVRLFVIRLKLFKPALNSFVFPLLGLRGDKSHVL